jgi:HEAT repeat protein
MGKRTIAANRLLRTLGLTAAGVVAVSALGVLLVRDQVHRHRRDLFSPRPLRRLAALTYIGKHPEVENAHLLRDFLSWEQEPMLRRRAASILGRMERRLADSEETEGSNGNGQATE